MYHHTLQHLNPKLLDILSSAPKLHRNTTFYANLNTIHLYLFPVVGQSHEKLNCWKVRMYH